jgi:hypothetical protein
MGLAAVWIFNARPGRRSDPEILFTTAGVIGSRDISDAVWSKPLVPQLGNESAAIRAV